MYALLSSVDLIIEQTILSSSVSILLNITIVYLKLMTVSHTDSEMSDINLNSTTWE